MSLAINNIFIVTEADSAKRLRVSALQRDKKGTIVEVAVVNCLHQETTEVFAYTEVDERMARGDWVLLGADEELEFDAKQRHVRCLEDIPEKRRANFQRVMIANMAAIRPILDLGWGAFIDEERNAMLAELTEKRSDRSTYSRAWLIKLLWRYWSSGNNPYALGPQNHRAGAKSRRAILQLRLPDMAKRRTGANPRVTVSYPDGTRTDRGGNAIPTGALPIIEKLVKDYFDDPFNQSLISITQHRWKGLPWDQVTKCVVRGLGKLPAYRNLKPTRRQISYLVNPSIDRIAVLRRSRGSRHVNSNNRQLNGDYRDVARFAGERYEGDTFYVDLHLVDDMTGLPIGRLRVYLIVDVFSGMVAGVYCTINEVDNAHVGRALHAAFAPKVDYCKLFGLEIQPGDWPCVGLPELFCGDNKELITKAAQFLPELVPTGITRSYRGDDKGSVEVNSGLTQSGHVYMYGEGVTQGPKQRCTDDPAKQATARVSTFMRELLYWVIFTHNHRAMPRTREIPAEFLKTKKLINPFNLWNWSRRERGGVLRRYNPTIMMPRLLPTAEARVDRRGIELDGLYFELPNEMDQLRAASTCSVVGKVRVHYDPLSTNQIYLLPRELSGTPIRCALTHYSREKLNLSWGEKKLRDVHVETIHRLTIHDENTRDEVSYERQRAAIESDKKVLELTYGSKRTRASIANQVSLEAVKDYQAMSDDTRLEHFVHAPAALLVDIVPDEINPPPVNSDPVPDQGNQPPTNDQPEGGDDQDPFKTYE